MVASSSAGRRVLVIILILSALSISFPLSSAVAAPYQQGALPLTLRIVMPEVQNLDPVALSRFDTHTRDLAENLFVGLTRYDPFSQAIEPALARSWKVSPDGLLWTFELRDDIYWVRADVDTGEPAIVRQVAAGDMVYAIQRACDPLRPSPVTANLMAIKGCHTVARAFPQLVTDLFIAHEMGVRATSPHTLEIELLFPVGHFLTLLSTPELRPLPREGFAPGETITRAALPITNGPFVVRSWTASAMHLVRNPFWPDPYSGNVQEIAIAFTSQANDALSLIEAGRADFTRLEDTQIADARARLPRHLQINAGSSLVFLGFSFERGLVQQPEYRRALSLAIDHPALTDQFFPYRSLPADSVLPPGAVGAQRATIATDRDAARRALEAAGYPGCSNITEPLIILVPDDDPVWAEVGTALVQEWTQVLGCNAALFSVKTVSRTLLIELGHATYDPEKVTRSHVWLFTWSADYPDASGWITDLLHCRYGYLRSGRSCDTADASMDLALATTDLAVREQLYAEVQDSFYGAQGSFPIAPLFWTASASLQQPRLSQVNTVGAARYDLWMLAPAS